MIRCIKQQFRNYLVKNDNACKIIIGFSFSIIALMWTGLYVIATYERETHIKNAVLQTANLVRAFEDHTLHTIENVDQTVMLIKTEYEKYGRDIDIAQYIRTGRVNNRPLVLLSVMDENGDLQVSSQTPFVFSNLKDREHFLVHKNIDTGNVFISKPVLGRSSGKLSIQLSRRINKTDGSFGGVVVASVSPLYFTEFYKNIDLGEKSSITLIGLDGVVRARQSGNNIEVGQDISEGVLSEKFQQNRSGNYLSTSKIDDVKRIHSFRVMENYPLALSVGMDEEYVLNVANQRIRGYYLTGFIFTCIVILLSALLLRNLKYQQTAKNDLFKANLALVNECADRQSIQEALLESEEKYRSIVENVHIGFCQFTDHPFTIIHANPALAKMFKLESPDALRKIPAQKFYANHRDLKSAVDDARKAGGIKNRELLLRARDGSQLWCSISIIAQYDKDKRIKWFNCVVEDITIQKSAYDSVFEKQTNQQAILDNIPYVAWLKDVESKFIAVNAAFAEECGISKESLIGKCDHDIFPRELAEKYRADDLKVIEQEKRFFHEEKFSSLLRGNRWMETFKTPIFNSLGEVVGTAGLAIDITERKARDKALVQSEQRYRAIVDRQSELICRFLPDGTITFVNPAYCTFFNLTSDMLIGENVLELMPKHLHESMRTYFKKMSLSGEQNTDEHKVVKANGEVRHVIWTNVPIVTANGLVTEIQSVGYDITERKDIEERLRFQQRQIETMMNSVPGYVFFVGEDGRYIAGNEMFCKAANLSTDELQGKTVYDLFPARLANKYWLDNQEIMVTGQQSSFEEELIDAGQTITVFTRKVPLKNDQGRVIGIVGLKIDITEIKKMEFELQQEKERAQMANRAKSDFLHSMSHELRTPLNAVIGFSEVLQDQYFGMLNPKQAEYINDILQSAQHLLSLINDILNIAKIESGKDVLNLEPLIITDILKSSVVMIREKANQRNIHLETSLSKELDDFVLWVDERKLKQVLFNLLSNAIKFTPESGFIKMRAWIKESELVVCVADSGLGIDENQQGKIFDSFYQVHSTITAKTPGTGLGLSITKQLIQMHGGEIWCESEGIGKGSSFYFTLPQIIPESKFISEARYELPNNGR